jgi:hypothetical protein
MYCAVLRRHNLVPLSRRCNVTPRKAGSAYGWVFATYHNFGEVKEPSSSRSRRCGSGPVFNPERCNRHAGLIGNAPKQESSLISTSSNGSFVNPIRLWKGQVIA